MKINPIYNIAKTYLPTLIPYSDSALLKSSMVKTVLDLSILRLTRSGSMICRIGDLHFPLPYCYPLRCRSPPSSRCRSRSSSSVLVSVGSYVGYTNFCAARGKESNSAFITVTIKVNMSHLYDVEKLKPTL